MAGLHPDLMGTYGPDKGGLDQADRMRGLLATPILQSRYLASGAVLRGNVETLAAWGFQY